jgi:hypothetical protein
VYSNIIININDLNIIVILGVYFEYILKFYVRNLLNILCPYYKFIQAILLYILKLLQKTFIIIYIKLYKITFIINYI